jgi:hypothetical protein
MGDAAWKRLNAKENDKRAKKATTTKTCPKPKELTIQRLSAEAVGKAQKFTRIGPREFVALNDDDDSDSEDLTIEIIKRACETHFLPQIGKNVVCDVLAGEQGPSCKY